MINQWDRSRHLIVSNYNRALDTWQRRQDKLTHRFANQSVPLPHAPNRHVEMKLVTQFSNTKSCEVMTRILLGAKEPI
jgi:hypothetical protein